MLSTEERLRLLSRLFTRPVLSSLAKRGEWRRSLGFLSSFHLLHPATPQPLANIFQDAWNRLSRSYRNEYVYKNEIANRIIFGLHSPRSAAFQIELPIGRSIVDVAVYNGTSTAYEVKTEFDSASRLDTQTKDYLRAFENVFVVTHPHFADRYAEIVNPTVGVLSLTTRGSLSLVKEPLHNSSCLDPETMFRCLRRHEYLHALLQVTGSEICLPNGIIRQYCSEVFAEIPRERAHALYVSAMRKRTTDRQTVEFLNCLPKCLRALGYGTPLSGRQRIVLLGALNEEVPFALV